MGKSPDAFRTISEVAEWLDTQPHVLRFWESKFTQVKPVKRAGGRRYYRPNDMLLLGGIKKLLHDDGMTIKGVQKILREQGIRHVSAMSAALDDVAGEDIDVSLDASTQPTTPAAPTAAPAPEEDRGTVLRFQGRSAQSSEVEQQTEPQADATNGTPDSMPEAEQTISEPTTAPQSRPEDVAAGNDSALADDVTQSPTAEAEPSSAPISEPELSGEPTKAEEETEAEAELLQGSNMPAFIRRSTSPIETQPDKPEKAPAETARETEPRIAAPARSAESQGAPLQQSQIEPQDDATPADQPEPLAATLKPSQISVPDDLDDSTPAPAPGLLGEIISGGALAAASAGEIGKLVDQLDAWRSAASHRGVS